MFEAHSQIICTIFGVKIYFYGVILAIAISIGTLVANFFGERYFGLKKDTIVDLAPYLVIFGIIGARLYYCCLNHDFYLRFPTEILAIRHGGISIHGAILGGFIGLIIFAKRHKISMPKLCDVTAIGLILAQAIGRWGNFFNSEAFGKPTDLPWKLYIAPQYRPIPYTEIEYFHPTFLYESILDLMLFFILFLLVKKQKTKKRWKYRSFILNILFNYKNFGRNSKNRFCMLYCGNSCCNCCFYCYNSSVSNYFNKKYLSK